MGTSIQKNVENNALQKEKMPTMQAYIKKMEGEIKKALPSVMTPERFTRITLSALSTNPKAYMELHMGSFPLEQRHRTRRYSGADPQAIPHATVSPQDSSFNQLPL